MSPEEVICKVLGAKYDPDMLPVMLTWSETSACMEAWMKIGGRDVRVQGAKDRLSKSRKSFGVA